MATTIEGKKCGRNERW